MTSHTHNLASLIGSRICHDLISPIGAIHNGIELLMLGQTKDVPDEEMSLIFDSCRHAENKVKFFRLAFGQNTADPQISRTKAEVILQDYLGIYRITLDWKLSGSASLNYIQALFTSALCLQAGLPRGGHISVEQFGEAHLIKGSGPSILQDELPWDLLAQSDLTSAVKPDNFEFALLPEFVAKVNLNIDITLADTSIEIALRP